VLAQEVDEKDNSCSCMIARICPRSRISNGIALLEIISYRIQKLIYRNSNPPPPQITFSQTQQLPTPQIKILRRQAPSNSNPENVVQTAQGKTYAEKEEEYRLARERIFGETSGSGSKSSSPVPAPTPTSRTPPISRGRTPDSARGVTGNGTLNTGGNGGGVVRQPRGPAEGGGFAGSGSQNTNGVGQFPPGW